MLGQRELVADALGHRAVVAGEVGLEVGEELGRDNGHVVLVRGEAAGDGSVESVAKTLDIALDLALRDFEALGDLGGPDRAMLAEESVDTGYALELTHELDLLY